MKNIFLTIAIAALCNTIQAQDSRLVELLQAQPGTEKILARTNSQVLMQASQRWHIQDSIHYAMTLRMAKEKGWPLTLPGGGELVGFDRNGLPIYQQDENVNAAKTTSTDDIQPGGSLGLNLQGTNMVIGLWETDIPEETHPEFAGRVVNIDNDAISCHATHVAGTLVATGLDTNAKGMATMANICAYNTYSSPSEIAATAASGLLISNHSYGTISGWNYKNGAWNWHGATDDYEDYKFGQYSFYAMVRDTVAFYAPYYLLVQSAGNDRGDGPSNDPNHPEDGPYDCISTYKNAKNILTVGAIGDFTSGCVNTCGLSMTNFSSWGPTDDGRIKPDIVGNGQGVYSANASGGYSFKSGTSMAAPNVAGSLLLLQEYYYSLYGDYMLSATLKALVIHTAGDDNNLPGPDYQFGWGLLNASEASKVIDNTEVAIILQDTLAEGETFQLNFDAASPNVEATICWTDPAGTPVAGNVVDAPNLMLVNDLDMRITQNANGTIHQPYILDPDVCSDNNGADCIATTGDNFRDNVEKVEFTAASGNYTLTINHKNTLTNGEQAFSLILTGFDCANAITAQTLTVNNQSFTSVADFSARDLITTGNTVQVGVGGDVSFKVVDNIYNPLQSGVIELNPGFEVLEGGNFETFIEECP